MQYAIEDIVEAFERKQKIKCKIVLGSSGKLTAQITAGAPFDVFLSADRKFPQLLLERGFAKSPPQTYATGQLALLASDSVYLSIPMLSHAFVKKIAIANPQTAPYGVVAKEFLDRAGILVNLEPKLVLGESVGQVNQFVSTGAAEVGLTALSTVIGQDDSKWVALNMEGIGRVEQQFVLLNQGRSKDESIRLFEAFILGTEAQGILSKWGYNLAGY